MPDKIIDYIISDIERQNKCSVCGEKKTIKQHNGNGYPYSSCENQECTINTGKPMKSLLLQSDSCRGNGTTASDYNGEIIRFGEFTLKEED